MKLIKIEHSRCADYDGASYLWAPDGFLEPEIEKDIINAQREYEKDTAIAIANKKGPVLIYQPYSQIPYRNYPDKTVKEVNEIWEQEKIKFDEWQEKIKPAAQSFEDYLIKKGYVGFYDYDIESYGADWGHQHGKPLKYGTTGPTTLRGKVENTGIGYRVRESRIRTIEEL